MRTGAAHYVELARAYARGAGVAERMTMEELLRTLTALPGPTGEEDAVLAWLEAEWGGGAR